ncbi:MAG TPA: cyclodeaminase/cyclohydrolase family protein [Mucilaginibacter sp.]|jgi:formiminotetrahydrofolate cyclodeaminase
MDSLITLPTDKLLEKFGAGSHKPGSGSAAALQGMLATQLMRTVIGLTADERRREKYRDHLEELLRIDKEIKDRVYGQLLSLFQRDSEEFDKAIQLRDARDLETDPARQKVLTQAATDALIPATELPLEIAKLCLELSMFGIYIFDYGFRSARGDSAVAINSAVSAVSGCLSIVNLNLLSFGNNEWTERIRSEVAIVKLAYDQMELEKNIRTIRLQEEADIQKVFRKEIDELNSGRWVGLSFSDKDIEEVAEHVQNVLWNYRSKLWKQNVPKDPIDVLKPSVVFEKILGYDYQEVNSLGSYDIGGLSVEVAGLINKRAKKVSLSTRFSPITRQFTAAHELGHALLHQQNVIHRDRPLNGGQHLQSRDLTELQADKFAVYFLMPEKQVKGVFFELFLSDKFVINEDYIFALTGETLDSFRRKYRSLRQLTRLLAGITLLRGEFVHSLSTIFGVSEGAMAIRLEELDLVEY